MANLTESSVYESGVPQLETTTPAIGGPGGVMNAQAQALANRTKFLKDVLDSPTELANRLPDATTSVKGKVQLASTGVQDATKVPKATGAEIASILTAGGYSLSPATGAANLDNIADGTTYKRITAAIATRLNTGKLYLPQYMARLGTETYVLSLVSLGSGVVLAGTSPSGQVYKSTDSGATWSLVQQLGAETNVSSFVSLGSGVVLAGTTPSGQVYKSTDSGANWSLVQRLGAETYVLSLVSLGSGIVLAGTCPSGQIHRFSEVSL